MRNFSVLSDIEFEGIVADLLAADLGRPVERFASGPDMGVDLRWRLDDGPRFGIAQCKHFQRSTFAQLLAAAKRELEHLEVTKPADYRFVTSFDLSTGQKGRLYDVLRGWMDGPDRVLGARDVDGLISLHPSVEQNHPKLWLATGTQLFWAAHADLANRASDLRDRLAASLPRYVVNRALEEARGILDRHSVCVIAGVPGIGKTMLAEVLVADAVAAGFEPIEVSGDIAEGWAALNPQHPQVFLYDDFLGQFSFAERLGKNEDARLAAFVSKVASTPSKMLVMTTREYILRDAQRAYERLRTLDEGIHFVLALGDYTRSDRARILYNHLWHGKVSHDALAEIAGGGYRRVVDHPNYSPRLIEYCTREPFDSISPGYVDRFVDVLDHPERLWRTAFETHLTMDQRLLGVALATMPSPALASQLQTAHRALCQHLAIPFTSSVFRTALQVMEGTFISIGKLEGQPSVSFHNPSVREFTLDWLLDDFDLLQALQRSAPFFEQMQQLYAALSRTGPSASESQLGGDMADVNEEFRENLKRTISGPCPVYRDEWDPDEGQVFRRKSSWFEDRVWFLTSLPPAWRPSDAWLEAQLHALAEHWRFGSGAKPEAVSLMRRLDVRGNDSPFRASPGIREELASALDEWLPKDLRETGTDWMPYLERLENLGVTLAEDRGLARRFESHAQGELRRWSPCPPEVDELRAYAQSFSLYELVDELELARDESEQEAARLAPARGGRSGSESRDRDGGDGTRGDDSDDAIEHLFRRLTQDRP